MQFSPKARPGDLCLWHTDLSKKKDELTEAVAVMNDGRSRENDIGLEIRLAETDNDLSSAAR